MKEWLYAVLCNFLFLLYWLYKLIFRVFIWSKKRNNLFLVRNINDGRRVGIYGFWGLKIKYGKRNINIL